jgi:hypothetical protein
VSRSNSLIIASDQRLAPHRAVNASAGNWLAPELDPLALQVGMGMTPAMRGGAVYTDDRAPVEWLTDLSILRYATGTR